MAIAIIFIEIIVLTCLEFSLNKKYEKIHKSYMNFLESEKEILSTEMENITKNSSL